MSLLTEHKVAIPPLDVAASRDFETATFALG